MEDQIIKGVVEDCGDYYSNYDIRQIGASWEHLIQNALQRVEGKRVRVTIEVIEDE